MEVFSNKLNNPRADFKSNIFTIWTKLKFKKLVAEFPFVSHVVSKIKIRWHREQSVDENCKNRLSYKSAGVHASFIHPKCQVHEIWIQ